MIDNSENVSKCNFQSYYSRDMEKYRNQIDKHGPPPHRYYSADFWEDTIPLIRSYLVSNGLKPEHKLLDLGAGGLRSALALVPYLNANNFYAIDINKFLLEDGYKYEIVHNKLDDKFPDCNIKITHDYDATDWGVLFDYVWSFSLWTHLDIGECEKCLSNVSKVLKPGGVYLTTCFIVTNSAYGKTNIVSSDVNIATYSDKDPFHHRLDSFIELGKKYNLEVEWMGIGSCCPRKHDVIKFTKIN
tara:strand:- start:1911 stop:2642 length:732 start_codon:yes stop_codon:yes gene_type:complete